MFSMFAKILYFKSKTDLGVFLCIQVEVAAETTASRYLKLLLLQIVAGVIMFQNSFVIAFYSNSSDPPAFLFELLQVVKWLVV